MISPSRKKKSCGPGSVETLLGLKLGQCSNETRASFRKQADDKSTSIEGSSEQQSHGGAREEKAERYQAAIVAKSRVTRFDPS